MQTQCPRCNTQNQSGSQFCANCALPLTNNAAPKKKGISTSVAIVIAVVAIFGMCGIMTVIIGLTAKTPPETAKATPAPTASISATPEPTKTVPGTKAAVKATPTPVPKQESYSTWSDFNRIFSIKSNSTDMQKESIWKAYQGKFVQWSGEVTDVQKGTFGGTKLNVKMNSDTLTYDVAVSLKDGQESRAESLTKGTKVTYSGILKSYGGAVLPTMLDDGEIK